MVSITLPITLKYYLKNMLKYNQLIWKCFIFQHKNMHQCCQPDHSASRQSVRRSPDGAASPSSPESLPTTARGQHHRPGALWPTLSAGNHTVCLSPLVPGFCPSPVGLWNSSGSGSCSLPEAASIPLYDTPQLFIHITVDGHLSSFLFLAIGITPLSSSKNNVFAQEIKL